MLACYHGHVHVVCLAWVSLVNLGRLDLSSSETFIELIVLNVRHHIGRHAQAVVIVIRVHYSSLVPGVSNLVVHLLTLLRTNEVALVPRAVLLGSVHHLPVGTEALLEIPVRTVVTLSLSVAFCFVAHAIASLLHTLSFVVVGLEPVLVHEGGHIVWLDQDPLFVSLAHSFQ